MEEEITEVSVGQTVSIAVTAADPNGGQNLVLTATSGLMSDFFQNKATFSNAGLFSWTVGSEQVREQPYQVVFKAKDSLNLEGLATFRLLRFHVNDFTGVSGANTAPLVLHLFPNPNPGTLRIDLPNPAITGQTLRIVDLAGRLIEEQPAQTGNKTQILEIDGLQSGSYMLLVLSSGRVLSIGKFIKE